MYICEIQESEYEPGSRNGGTLFLISINLRIESYKCQGPHKLQENMFLSSLVGESIVGNAKEWINVPLNDQFRSSFYEHRTLFC